MKYINFKLLIFFLTALLAFGVGWAGTVIDEITLSTTGVTTNTSSYTPFSGKKATSDAVYAGKCAGGNASIQLRSKNDDSGVITTGSGGKVKSVTIEFNTNTTANRTVEVYGKNNAYSSAGDLFDSSTKGTLLGTAQYYQGTTKTVNVSGDYTYVGIRSKSDPLYIAKITIVWETEGETPTNPWITISPSVKNINDEGAEFTVEGGYLPSGNVGVYANSAHSTNFSFNLSSSANTVNNNDNYYVVNSDDEVDGTFTLNYTGHALSATGLIGAAIGNVHATEAKVNYLYDGDIYIVGNVNEYSWNEPVAGVKMTKNANGTYSSEIEVTGGGYFYFTKEVGAANYNVLGDKRFGPRCNNDYGEPQSGQTWTLSSQTTGVYCDLDTVNKLNTFQLQAGNYLITIDPALNQFKIVAVAGPKIYNKVVDASQLVPTKKYILVHEDDLSGSTFLGGISTTSTKYGIAVDGPDTESGSVDIRQYPDIRELTLSGDENGWSFHNGDGYLRWSSGNSLDTESTVTNNSKWTVTENFALINVADGNRKVFYNYNGGSNPRFAAYDVTKTTISDADGLAVLYVEDGVNPVLPNVAKPTILPEERDFLKNVEVSIECTTAGASIYYTLDGTDPTASSTLYSAPFTLNDTTTVKAIAVLGNESSAIAEATFTKTGIETIAKAQALPTSGANANFTFVGDAVVTFHNGQYLYIRDDSGSGLIYYNTAPENTFSNGDVLTAGWKAKNAIYQTYTPEFTSPSGVSKASNNGAVEPEILTSIQLTDVNKYAGFNGVKIENSNGQNYYITIDGVDYCLRRAYTDLVGELTVGKKYNVTGVVTIYRGGESSNYTYTPQLNLITATPVKEDPALEFNPTSVSVYAGVTDFPEPTLTKPEGVTVSYASDNADVVTVDANTGVVTIVGPGTANITASSTATDFYTAGTASYAVEIKAMVAAGLSYPEGASVTATVGDENVEEPELTNPNNLTGITYSSSDTNVATVDAATGEVTVVGPGTATITATFDGNEQYNEGSASYTITVNNKPLTVTLTPASGEYTVGQKKSVTYAVENAVGDVLVDVTIQVNDETPETTTYENPTEFTIELPSYNAGTVKVTVTALDEREDPKEVTAIGTYTFTAAPAIGITLTADPDKESYTVGETVNVKVATTNTIGNDVEITYSLTDARESELTYDDTKGIDITSNEAGTVTLTVNVLDGYDHEGANESGITSTTAEYTFVKAGAITITFDPASGAEFNVGDPNAKVKVTIAGAADDYQAEYTVGDETGDVPADGIITLPNAKAGDVTLEVTVVDGLEHEGETTASATYKFNKAAAGLSFSATEASATVGSAFTAPTLSNENGLTVTYTSSNENVATVAADGTVTIVGEGTTIITATFAGNDQYNEGSASYTLTVAPQPVVATPVITPNGGSYSETPVEVTITCATPEAVISYSTNGTTWTEGTSLTVSENCTVYAKATKAGSIDSDVAQAVFKFEIPEEPVGPVLKGYYQIKNNGNGQYANVLGRKTLRFTGTPDAEAGTVIYVETSDKGDGQVVSLRSQAADLQGYANRAMRYVPEVVQLVVNKLHAVGPGEELGTTGYDAIMTAFNESFDYHLYVEQGDKGYRLYGKTPSMQPVVDFYREYKDKVEAKVPMIEGFVNEAIQKILQKTNGQGQSILVPYSIHEVWENMGGEESGITEPVTGNDVAILNFYRDILNDKDNVWNFAYQSVMIYWSKLKDNDTFIQMKPQLGEFANYIDKLEQIRPNAKYYVVQTGNEPDYVSDGNILIDQNDDCTYWTLEPRDKFTVNFPADNKYGDQYVTTLYTDFAYQLPNDVTAYKVTEIDDKGIAKIEALTAPIAAQTPVLLMAKATRATEPKELTIAESGNAVDGNLLVGPEFLIERDSILTPQIATLFGMVRSFVSEDFYNTYVKEYEHLMFRNSGLVNNKYFWGLPEADLWDIYDDDTDIRALGVADGKIAFNEHWQVLTNKAFLINKDFDVINLAIVETPVITPVPENPYTEPVEVTITCATEGATILYTTDGGENWNEYTEPFTLSETTTVQAYATMTGLGDSEKTEEVQYVIELPVATPVVTPEGGSYGSAPLEVKITCDTPDAVIYYSIDGGEWTEYKEPFYVSEDCTIQVKAEKDGMTPSETSVSYVFEIPEMPTGPTLKGYYYIKNNESENLYANVLGRKTLHFTNAPEDQAGTVFYFEAENGQVQSLRSQAADFQGYVDRALNYVPKVVQIVVNKLHAAQSGALLGTTGYEELLEAFNESIKYYDHLCVESVEGSENVYRLYAKTPSMQHVVDFYRSHKDKVDAKLPQLEGFINDALHKVLDKTDGVGASILVDYDIHDVWFAMGGESSGLTEPTDSVTDLAFYQEVLNDKDNVWNFAYQSVMLYWNRLIQNTTFQETILPNLGSDAQYLEYLTDIRPNTKYYVIKNGDELDYVSEDHVYITGDQPKTYWTLEPRTTFDVNVPSTFEYRGKYVTTLYTDFAYELPGGVTAYKVDSINNKGVAFITALTSPIAAQTPVLLMADKAETKTLTIAESGNAVTGNMLVGPDFLIERDSILTDQVAALFGFAKAFLNEEFYEANVKQYEHLMFRTAGMVNNKYFWGISEDDLTGYCTFKNDDGEEDTDIRSLGVEDGTAAFCDHWTVATNKAFLIDETKAFQTLYLPVKDITRDGYWDISDATALINILLTLPERPYDPEWDYEAADFDLSGEIDITDALTLINYLLNKSN